MKTLLIFTGSGQKRKVRKVNVETIVSRKTFSGLRKPRKPLRQGVDRYPGGQIKHGQRGESAEDVLRVAVEARAKHTGLPVAVVREDAAHGRLGTVLGRLRHEYTLSDKNHGIDERQMQACIRFARVLFFKDVIDDVPRGFAIPPAARLACTFGRQPYDALDPDLAWDAIQAQARRDMILSVNAGYADLRLALWEMEASADTTGCYSILHAVAVQDRDVVSGNGRALGTLRCAANRLAQMWKLEASDGDR